MAREEGLCPFTGRADVSLKSRTALPDILNVAHIIGQSVSEGTKWGKEETCKKVGSLPNSILYHETTLMSFKV